MEISKNALISFLFGGKYKDEVLCDITPMDGSHLLGRPWKYGRNVEHDVFNNTYSFIKDGHKIVVTHN